MDAYTFDLWTRTFVASRRRAVAMLAAAAAGAWGGSHSAAAGPNCGRVGYPCPANTKCCAGALCVDGLCACRQGFKECNGVCSDVASDAANCGGCGIACRAKEVCREGRCRRGG